MASKRTMQSGDTYPPLRGLAADQDGPVDLPSADSMTVHAQGQSHNITLTATVIDPPVTIGGETYNWEADFAAGDTNFVGTYTIQLIVTWNANDIETFPNDRASAPQLVIEQRNT